MTITAIKNLIPLLVKGQQSAEQQQAFETWLQLASPEELSEVMDLYYDALDGEDIISFMPADFPANFQNRMRAALPTQRLPKKPTRYLRIAAAVALLLAAGTGVLLLTNKPAPKVAEQVIKPGTDKAILTLADGRKVELGGSQNDSIIQSGVQVIQLNSTVISYAGTSGDQHSFNTLTTPRGAQFQIVLPDGSRVWLNAVSSLRYPVAFSNQHRTVELSGQAYFDVTPSTTPFIVKSGTTSIEVLGTDFDVMAYAEEGPVTTTLVKGSIAVQAGSSRKQLQPGEQVTYNETKKELVLSHPAIEEVIAWKEGEFRFNGVSIIAIMRQLSRWYDVDIRYEGPLPTTAFSGTLSRKENVKQILYALEATEAAHFTIEGNTIVVKK
ncbi:FecR family protein [Chitinophaga sp. sic0106]|uniref:FecR family protein n=1 Tax=Chitinophaga sp. sic0106 TaxID=2854785 RepID=UPI001C462FEC|nr:FecR family protein [Chitinophaga sp. sic0106]MBV7531102.1 FecR domain-containing protein [Chitinophaga sp. sic0106]